MVSFLPARTLARTTPSDTALGQLGDIHSKGTAEGQPSWTKRTPELASSSRPWFPGAILRPAPRFLPPGPLPSTPSPALCPDSPGFSEALRKGENYLARGREAITSPPCSLILLAGRGSSAFSTSLNTPKPPQAELHHLESNRSMDPPQCPQPSNPEQWESPGK